MQVNGVYRFRFIDRQTQLNTESSGDSFSPFDTELVLRENRVIWDIFEVCQIIRWEIGRLLIFSIWHRISDKNIVGDGKYGQDIIYTCEEKKMTSDNFFFTCHFKFFTWHFESNDKWFFKMLLCVCYSGFVTIIQILNIQWENKKEGFFTEMLTLVFKLTGFKPEAEDH